jgi:hypothetical protein
MLPRAVCAALADRHRLRLFGRIAAEAAGLPVAGLTLDERDRKALNSLLQSGVIGRTGDHYVARPETFRQALAEQDSDTAMIGASARVGALFSGGKLTSMPRPGALRRELLSYLAERFERDRTYSEKELQQLLAPVLSDHATLRRYLVEEGIMARDNLGTYWRADVPVSAAG